MRPGESGAPGLTQPGGNPDRALSDVGIAPYPMSSARPVSSIWCALSISTGTAGPAEEPRPGRYGGPDVDVQPLRVAGIRPVDEGQAQVGQRIAERGHLT